MKQSRSSAPKTKSKLVSAFSAGSESPTVTWVLIALCVLVYIAQLVSGGRVGSALLYYPPITEIEPWRMVTSMFAHSESSIFHIIFNMYSLIVIGPIMEKALGHLRFLALYLLSGLGGSVGVLLIDPKIGVLGASGAIFGLLGAFFIINRHFGGNNLQIIIVIGLNLVAGFLFPNVAWQAHVGGLITGGIVAFVFLKTRAPKQQTQQLILIVTVLIGLIVLTILGVNWMWTRIG